MAQTGLKYIEVILPLSLEGTFTYHLSLEEAGHAKIGQRVVVSFGSRKLYTGIIHSIHDNKPELYKTKSIYAFLDEYAMVTQRQIAYWEWIADYYMCSLGDVFRDAFPSALKLESETFVRLANPDAELTQQEMDELSDKEYLIYEGLVNRQIISVHEAAEIVDDRSAISLLKSLLDKNIIRLDEKLQKKYTPKIENYIRLKDGLMDDQVEFNTLLDGLNKAPKQKEALIKLITLESQNPRLLKVSEFIKLSGAANAVLRALEEKNAVVIEPLQTSRIDDSVPETKQFEALTAAQKEAYDQINHQFESKTTVLLHGVTSSGKTHIYQQLIQDTFDKNQKVLYLLPELGVATQIIQRLQHYFGERVGVYHSKFNQNERVEIWQKVLNHEYDLLIGSRSVIHLPFENVGLIIVDEEHESSYKQTAHKPFLNARDMALVLGGMTKAKVLLGSATPSMESYRNGKEGKYGYVELTERFGKAKMPAMSLIDLKNAMKKKLITEDISHDLRDEITEVLKEKKQVIIFQNRRGYAPALECNDCGHTPFCPNCDVTLTYHKYPNLLKCHYCSYSITKPSKCSACSSPNVQTKGIGTEQIEHQLEKMFPDARIKRMDVDAMRGKYAYEKLIDDFENQEVDIVVGTQMITKGLDFKNVALVGVVRADSLLNFPDFRAQEKAFQLLYQVAGRAGRRGETGKVLIQTYNPYHQVLQNLTLYRYHETAKDILYERKNFLYPPYCRLIHIRFRHSKKERVDKTAMQFVTSIKPLFQPNHLLGPEAPVVSRINNLYIMDVLLKIGPNIHLGNTKKQIKTVIANMQVISAFRSVRIDIDVDPV